MTTYYVDSAAGGSNDGTSWTDAWTSLASSAGVAAGSVVLVDDGHSETPAGSQTLDWANGTVASPVRIITVDKSDDSLSSGASYALSSSGNLAVIGNIVASGISFASHSGHIYLGEDNGRQGFVSCVFTIAATTTGRQINCNYDSCFIYFDTCTFDLSNDTDYSLGVASEGAFSYYKNCTITTTAGQDGLFSRFFDGTTVVMECCDIGAVDYIVDTDVYAVITLRRCKLSAFTGIASGSFIAPASISIEQCQSSTISDTPVTFTSYSNINGTVANTTAVYRTGGASDGTNSYSYSMTPSASAEEQCWGLETPLLTAWVTGGSSTTFTIYVAGGAELYDDEVWIELQGPDDTANPNTTTQGYFYSSRLPFQSTRAALTTDGDSTWNGTGVGTVRKITHTYTPAESGPVVVKVVYAKTSGAAVYVDPKVFIT